MPIAGSAADIYVQQGLFGEAAKIYRGILERDPNNTEVAKKLMDLEDRMRRQLAQEISEKTPPPSTTDPAPPPTAPSSSTPPPDAAASSSNQGSSADPYLPPEADAIVREKETPPDGGTTPK
jgi:hypothetical protein